MASFLEKNIKKDTKNIKAAQQKKASTSSSSSNVANRTQDNKTNVEYITPKQTLKALTNVINQENTFVKQAMTGKVLKSFIKYSPKFSTIEYNRPSDRIQNDLMPQRKKVDHYTNALTKGSGYGIIPRVYTDENDAYVRMDASQPIEKDTFDNLKDLRKYYRNHLGNMEISGFISEADVKAERARQLNRSARLKYNIEHNQNYDKQRLAKAAETKRRDRYIATLEKEADGTVVASDISNPYASPFTEKYNTPLKAFVNFLFSDNPKESWQEVQHTLDELFVRPSVSAAYLREQQEKIDREILASEGYNILDDKTGKAYKPRGNMFYAYDSQNKTFYAFSFKENGNGRYNMSDFCITPVENPNIIPSRYIDITGIDPKGILSGENKLTDVICGSQKVDMNAIYKDGAAYNINPNDPSTYEKYIYIDVAQLNEAYNNNITEQSDVEVNGKVHLKHRALGEVAQSALTHPAAATFLNMLMAAGIDLDRLASGMRAVLYEDAVRSGAPIGSSETYSKLDNTTLIKRENTLSYLKDSAKAFKQGFKYQYKMPTLDATKGKFKLNKNGNIIRHAGKMQDTSFMTYFSELPESYKDTVYYKHYNLTGIVLDLFTDPLLLAQVGSGSAVRSGIRALDAPISTKVAELFDKRIEMLLKALPDEMRNVTSFTSSATEKGIKYSVKYTGNKAPTKDVFTKNVDRLIEINKLQNEATRKKSIASLSKKLTKAITSTDERLISNKANAVRQIFKDAGYTKEIADEFIKVFNIENQRARRRMDNAILNSLKDSDKALYKHYDELSKSLERRRAVKNVFDKIDNYYTSIVFGSVGVTEAVYAAKFGIRNFKKANQRAAMYASEEIGKVTRESVSKGLRTEKAKNRIQQILVNHNDKTFTEQFKSIEKELKEEVLAADPTETLTAFTDPALAEECLEQATTIAAQHVASALESNFISVFKKLEELHRPEQAGLPSVVSFTDIEKIIKESFNYTFEDLEGLKLALTKDVKALLENKTVAQWVMEYYGSDYFENRIKALIKYIDALYTKDTVSAVEYVLDLADQQMLFFLNESLDEILNSNIHNVLDLFFNIRKQCLSDKAGKPIVDALSELFDFSKYSLKPSEYDGLIITDVLKEDNLAQDALYNRYFGNTEDVSLFNRTIKVIPSDTMLARLSNRLQKINKEALDTINDYTDKDLTKINKDYVSRYEEIEREAAKALDIEDLISDIQYRADTADLVKRQSIILQDEESKIYTLLRETLNRDIKEAFSRGDGTPYQGFEKLIYDTTTGNIVQKIQNKVDEVIADVLNETIAWGDLGEMASSLEKQRDLILSDEALQLLREYRRVKIETYIPVIENTRQYYVRRNHVQALKLAMSDRENSLKPLVDFLLKEETTTDDAEVLKDIIEEIIESTPGEELPIEILQLKQQAKSMHELMQLREALKNTSLSAEKQTAFFDSIFSFRECSITDLIDPESKVRHAFEYNVKQQLVYQNSDIMSMDTFRNTFMPGGKNRQRLLDAGIKENEIDAFFSGAHGGEADVRVTEFRQFVDNYEHAKELNEAAEYKDVWGYDLETYGPLRSAAPYELAMVRWRPLKLSKKAKTAKNWSELDDNTIRKIFKHVSKKTDPKDNIILRKKFTEEEIAVGLHPDRTFLEKAYGSFENWLAVNAALPDEYIMDTQQLAARFQDEMADKQTLSKYQNTIYGFNNHKFDNLIISQYPALKAWFSSCYSEDLYRTLLDKKQLLYTPAELEEAMDLFNKCMNKIRGEGQLTKLHSADTYGFMRSIKQLLNKQKRILETEVQISSVEDFFAGSELINRIDEFMEHINLLYVDLADGMQSQGQKLHTIYVKNFEQNHEFFKDFLIHYMKQAQPSLTDEAAEALVTRVLNRTEEATEGAYYNKFHEVASLYDIHLHSGDSIDLFKLEGQDLINKLDEIMLSTGNQPDNIIRRINSWTDGAPSSEGQSRGVTRATSNKQLQYFKYDAAPTVLHGESVRYLHIKTVNRDKAYIERIEKLREREDILYMAKNTSPEDIQYAKETYASELPEHLKFDEQDFSTRYAILLDAEERYIKKNSDVEPRLKNAVDTSEKKKAIETLKNVSSELKNNITKDDLVLPNSYIRRAIEEDKDIFKKLAKYLLEQATPEDKQLFTHYLDNVINPREHYRVVEYLLKKYPDEEMTKLYLRSSKEKAVLKNIIYERFVLKQLPNLFQDYYFTRLINHPDVMDDLLEFIYEQGRLTKKEYTYLTKDINSIPGQNRIGKTAIQYTYLKKALTGQFREKLFKQNFFNKKYTKQNRAERYIVEFYEDKKRPKGITSYDYARSARLEKTLSEKLYTDHYIYDLYDSLDNTTDTIETLSSELSLLTGTASAHTHYSAMASKDLSKLLDVIKTKTYEKRVAFIGQYKDAIKELDDIRTDSFIKTLREMDVVQRDKALVEYLTQQDKFGLLIFHITKDNVENFKELFKLENIETFVDAENQRLYVGLKKHKTEKSKATFFKDLVEKTNAQEDLGLLKYVVDNDVVDQAYKSASVREPSLLDKKLSEKEYREAFKHIEDTQLREALIDAYNSRLWLDQNKQGDYTHGFMTYKNINKFVTEELPTDVQKAFDLRVSTLETVPCDFIHNTTDSTKYISGINTGWDPLQDLANSIKHFSKVNIDRTQSMLYFLNGQDLLGINHLYDEVKLSDADVLHLIKSAPEMIPCALVHDPVNIKKMETLEKRLEELENLSKEKGTTWRKNDDSAYEATLEERDRIREELSKISTVRVQRFDIDNLSDLKFAREHNICMVPVQVYETTFSDLNYFSAPPMVRTFQKYMSTMKASYLATLGTFMRNTIDETLKTINDVGWENAPSVLRNNLIAIQNFNVYNKMMRYIQREAGTPVVSNATAIKIYRYMERTNPAFKALTKQLDFNSFSDLNMFMSYGASGGGLATAARKSLLNTNSVNIEYNPDNAFLDNFKTFFTANKNKQTTAADVAAFGEYAANAMMSAPFAPLEWSEKLSRYAHHLSLKEQGIVGSKSYEAISATHFNYDIKDRGTIYAELIIPFFNYMKLNAEYWSTEICKNPRILHDLERYLYAQLRPEMTDVHEDYETGNYQHTFELQQILAGNLRIRDLGIANIEDQAVYLKINPSIMDALNLFMDPGNQVLRKVFTPFQLGLEQSHLFENAIEQGLYEAPYSTNGWRSVIPYLGSLIEPTLNSMRRISRNTFTQDCETYCNTVLGQLMSNPATAFMVPGVFAFESLNYNSEDIQNLYIANGYAFDAIDKRYKKKDDPTFNKITLGNGKTVLVKDENIAEEWYRQHHVDVDMFTGEFVPYGTGSYTRQDGLAWNDARIKARERGLDFDYISGRWVSVHTTGAIFNYYDYKKYQEKQGLEWDCYHREWVKKGTAVAVNYDEAAEYARIHGYQYDYIRKEYVPYGTAYATSTKDAKAWAAKRGLVYDYVRRLYVKEGAALIDNWDDYKAYQATQGLEYDYSTKEWVPIGTAKQRAYRYNKLPKFDTWRELELYQKARGLGWDPINKRWVDIDKVPTWNEYHEYMTQRGYEWDTIEHKWVPEGTARAITWQAYKNYCRLHNVTWDSNTRRYVGKFTPAAKNKAAAAALFNSKPSKNFQTGKNSYVYSVIHQYINRDMPYARVNVRTMPATLNMLQAYPTRYNKLNAKIKAARFLSNPGDYQKYYKNARI